MVRIAQVGIVRIAIKGNSSTVRLMVELFPFLQFEIFPFVQFELFIFVQFELFPSYHQTTQFLKERSNNSVSETTIKQLNL